MAKPLCPNCHSGNTCTILYGLPEWTKVLDDDLESGEIYLGGCIAAEDSPAYHCNACEKNFNYATLNIYLDIDGVLLSNDLHPANHAAAFLRYVLTNYPDSTYWLTTHCQGDASVPIQHIGHLFDAETVALMKKIKPTTWDLAKTRAIDFKQPFLWFDDNVFFEEQQMSGSHYTEHTSHITS